LYIIGCAVVSMAALLLMPRPAPSTPAAAVSPEVAVEQK